MNDTEVRQIVERAIHRVAPEADVTRVPVGADFREELEIDSMDFLIFVDELHEKTGIDIPERDYPAFASIEGCVTYLAARLPGSAGAPTSTQ